MSQVWPRTLVQYCHLVTHPIPLRTTISIIFFPVEDATEGLYNLYLVNCDWRKHVLVNLETYIIEKNRDGDYLSAGEKVSLFSRLNCSSILYVWWPCVYDIEASHPRPVLAINRRSQLVHLTTTSKIQWINWRVFVGTGLLIRCIFAKVVWRPNFDFLNVGSNHQNALDEKIRLF